MHAHARTHAKTNFHMKIETPTLDILPPYKANCATCTRKGGTCPRNKNIKNLQHNGLIFSPWGEVSGMIAGCLNYTGKYNNEPTLFDMK